MTHEAILEITMGMTMGDTTGATGDFTLACGFDGVPYADLTYSVNLQR